MGACINFPDEKLIAVVRASFLRSSGSIRSPQGRIGAASATLFVAHPEDAPHYAEDDEDYECVGEVESFPMGGMNSLHFETLWAITEGQPWDPKRHSFEWVGEPPEGEAGEWRFRLGRRDGHHCLRPSGLRRQLRK